MNEEFVTFDLAKKLKEKGFIGNVDIGQYGGYYYHDGEDMDVCYDCVDNADIAANEYLRPTISQVLKWLRDEKKIHIQIIVYENGWYFEIWQYNDSAKFKFQGEDCDSYEKAALAGITWALDKLI